MPTLAGRALGLSLGLCVAAPAQIPLGDLNPFTLDPDSAPGPFVAVGGSVYFAAATAATGRELFVAAPSAGAALLVDLHPGPASSNPQHLAVVAGRLLWFAEDAAGFGLWSSDGTAQQRLMSLAPAVAPAAAQIEVVGGQALAVGVEPGRGAGLYGSDGVAVRRLLGLGSSGELLGACALGRELLVSVRDGAGATLLLRSDGVAAQVVASSAQGGPTLLPPLVASNGHGFFPAIEPGASEPELWISDGTPVGTYLVARPSPGRGSYRRGLVAFGNRVAYLGNGASYGDEPIVSDGTAAGTVIVDVNIMVGRGSSPAHLTVLGNDLLLCAISTRGPGLHRVDGNALTVSQLAPLLWRDDGTAQMVAAGGLVFLRGFDPARAEVAQLLVSDGTAAGTQVLRELRRGRQDCRFAFPTALGAQVVFANDDGLLGLEPWFSDGTSANTRPLANVHVGSGGRGSVPSFFLPARQAVLFDADDDLDGRGLWRSDGTAPGTSAVRTQLGDARAVPLGTLGGDAYLAYTPPTGATAILRSDGSAAGTQVLPGANFAAPLPGVARDGDRALWLVAPRGNEFALVRVDRGGATALATAPTALRDLALLRGAPLFAAASAATGYELHTLSGLLRDINPGPASSDPGRGMRVELAGLLLFDADDGVAGVELWRSDGTASGTQRLLDLAPGPVSSAPRAAVVSGGRVFFVATTPQHGAELWASDGTAAGTRLLADLAPGPASSAPTALCAQHGGVYFAADDGAVGRELWFSDGQDVRLVRDIAPGIAGSSPRELSALGSRRVVFVADDGREGEEPWVSDGTAAGTRLMVSLRAGPQGSDPQALALSADGWLVLRADDGVHGAEPWAVDPGALAQPVSGECGVPGLQLSAVDPQLGAACALRLAHASAPAGVLVLGAARFDAVLGCTLYADAASLAVPVALASGAVSLALFVPNQVSLLGRTLRLQAAAGPFAAPPGLAFSPAWSLRLGR